MLIADDSVNDTIYAKLFDTTPAIHEALKTSEDPLVSYLGLQEKLVD